MKPRKMCFNYPDALEAYGKDLKEMTLLDLKDEVDRMIGGIKAKVEIIQTACRADDGLTDAENTVYRLMSEIEEHLDRADAGADELHERLKAAEKGNGKGKANGE